MTEQLTKLKELLEGLINCVSALEMSTDSEADNKEVWKCRDEILSLFRELEAERDELKNTLRRANAEWGKAADARDKLHDERLEMQAERDHYRRTEVSNFVFKEHGVVNTTKLTEQLRYYLKKELAKSTPNCASCGRKFPFHSLRGIAKELGIAPATLHRFHHGKSCDSNTIDKLYARYFV